MPISMLCFWKSNEKIFSLCLLEKKEEKEIEKLYIWVFFNRFFLAMFNTFAPQLTFEQNPPWKESNIYRLLLKIFKFSGFSWSFCEVWTWDLTLPIIYNNNKFENLYLTE